MELGPDNQSLGIFFSMFQMMHTALPAQQLLVSQLHSSQPARQCAGFTKHHRESVTTSIQILF